MSVVVKGSVAVTETAESGRIEEAESYSRSVQYTGSYALLLALRPAKNAVWGPIPSLRVASTRLTPRKGDLGLLDIQLEPLPAAPGGTEEANEPLKDTWEKDWAQLEKPILAHKVFSGSGQTQADAIALWRDSTDPEHKKAYEYPDGTEEVDGETVTKWTALDDFSKKYAQKIMRGQESFLTFYPVISRTRIYQLEPVTGNCGTVQTPDVNIAGWLYLKTADRAVQNSDNTWTRTEQWTGAEEWDSDFYDPAEAN